MKRVLLGFIFSIVAVPVYACQLALILAIDVSSSIDRTEFRFQVDGLANALLEPEIMNILVQDQVALSVVQWSGHNEHVASLPWRRMLTPQEVANFSERVRAMRRQWIDSKTAVGDVINFSADQFAMVPDCRRRVIDVSGDGNTNAGAETSSARRAAQERGIEINGLAIDRVGVGVTDFFRRFVVTDQGFVITSSGYNDYPRAIRAKLLRELVKPSS